MRHHIVIAIGGLVLALTFLLTDCAHKPPLPEGEDCAAACANVERLGCMRSTEPPCIDVCEAHEADDHDLVNEACVARAESCAAIEACE